MKHTRMRTKKVWTLKEIERAVGASFTYENVDSWNVPYHYAATLLPRLRKNLRRATITNPRSRKAKE